MSGFGRVRRWRDGEIGLSIALALQIAVMFVAAPLSATGVLPPLGIDILRMGLAAAAVLLVSRSHRLSLLVGAASCCRWRSRWRRAARASTSPCRWSASPRRRPSTSP